MEPKAQSEFNYALAWLERIDAEFKLAAKASLELDAHKWFHVLLLIYRELSTEMTAASDLNKKAAHYVDSLADKVTHWVAVSNAKGIRSMPPQLYHELHDFELTLRKIMDKAGMQTRRKDDPALLQ